MRLKKSLTEMVKRLPIECKNAPEYEIREKLNTAVNAILSDLSEFISDDWTDTEEEPITDDEE